MTPSFDASTFIRTLTLTGLLAGAVACGPSVESVCRDACAKSAECGIGFGDVIDIGGLAPETDKEVEICQATCDARQLKAELEVDQGQREAECVDREVDRDNCIVGLDCSALRNVDFSECKDQFEAAVDACN